APLSSPESSPRRRRDDVAFHARELALIEEQRDLALLALAVGRFAPIHIIPAIGVEDVVEQGRAENEAHLLARHAGLDLRELFLRQVIALLDLRLVRRDARHARHAAAAEQQED